MKRDFYDRYYEFIKNLDSKLTFNERARFMVEASLGKDLDLVEKYKDERYKYWDNKAKQDPSFRDIWDTSIECNSEEKKQTKINFL